MNDRLLTEEEIAQQLRTLPVPGKLEKNLSSHDHEVIKEEMRLQIMLTRDAQDVKTARILNEEWALKFDEARQQILREMAEWLAEHHSLHLHGGMSEYVIFDKDVEALKEGKSPMKEEEHA